MTMGPVRIAVAGLLLGAVVAPAAEASKWPVPAAPLNDAEFGAGLQRTMTLLATSTPERRNTVRVLFYGQSITSQAWSHQVASFLRATWPDANLIVENRSIGGFGSQLLHKTAEPDLYPFYPDLMVFHVYGGHEDYEKIIRRTRERTTAEILIQTDHITKDEDLDEECDPAKLTAKQGSAWFNYAFLPQTARQYGAELCDQRSEWKRYLRANHLKAKDLLRDSVHLNDHGCYLMAELVKQHLRYRPQQSDAAWRDLVRTYTVGREVNWQDGRLRLEFDGNRVDLIAGAGPVAGAPTQVLVDGLKPSAVPELTVFTRNSAYPKVWWPSILLIGSAAPLVPEDWSARIFEASDDLKSFKFEVVGSVTGADGVGTNKERFVSQSGRVVIEPGDWFIWRSREYGKVPLPDGYAVKWQAVPQYTELYNHPEVQVRGVETATTLAKGLRPGRHTLELVARAAQVPTVAALRVYRPPLSAKS